MSISDQLLELNTAKQNIKNAIQDNLGQDLSEVAFVDYHQYIKSNGGYYAPTLNITFEEKTEYVVGESVTFNGVTTTLDGSTILSDVPIFHDGMLVVSSDSDGKWSYTTTWKSGGCTFTVEDDTYGVVCKENVYPHEQFYDSFTNLQTLVDTLKDGETLTLDCNYRYLETGTGEGVTIEASNITIDGQGKYTLDGNNLSGIIFISTASDVSLKGLTFKKGKRVVYNIRGHGLSIIDSTFIENTDAAIYNVYGNNVSIMNSTFVGNISENDGVITTLYGGNFSVMDSTFTANTGRIVHNDFANNVNADSCYWGTNTPTFDDTVVYRVAVDVYDIIEVTTASGYIIVQSIPSTTSTCRTPLGNVEATITVGGNTYKKTLQNGMLRQAYTAPTVPYDITAQLASGEVLTKTIES